MIRKSDIKNCSTIYGFILPIKIILISLVFLLLLSGCYSMIESRHTRLEAVVTASAVFRVEPSSTPIPQATSTPVPVATASPTAVFYLPDEIRLPEIKAVDAISAENVDALSLLGVMGRGMIRAITAFPNKAYIAAASTQGISIIRSTSMQEVVWLPDPGVELIKISPSGRYLIAIYSKEEVSVWDVTQGKKIRTYAAVDAAIHPDDDLLILGNTSGTLWLESIHHERAPLYLEGHTKAIRSVGFSFSGEIAGSTSDDKSVRLWSIETRKLLFETQKHKEPADFVLFSPVDDLFITGNRNAEEIYLWRIGHNDPIMEGKKSVQRQDIVFSPDGKNFAYPNRFRGQPGVAIINTTSGETTHVGANTPDLISLTWDSSNKILAANRKGLIYYVIDNNNVRLYSYQPKRLVFSPDSQSLSYGPSVFHLRNQKILTLTVDINSIIEDAWFDVESGKLLTLTYNDPFRLVYLDSWHPHAGGRKDRVVLGKYNGQHHKFSPSGKWIMHFQDGASFWKVSTLNADRIEKNRADYLLRGTFSEIWFSPDESFVISASPKSGYTRYDGRYFGIQKRGEKSEKNILSAAFTLDNSRLVIGYDDGSITIWNQKNQALFSIEAHHTGVSALAISMNDELVASSANDSTLNIWNLEDGSLLQSIQVKEGSVKALAFSPDGSLLAVGLTDGAVVFYGIPTTGTNSK